MPTKQQHVADPTLRQRVLDLLDLKSKAPLSYEEREAYAAKLTAMLGPTKRLTGAALTSKLSKLKSQRVPPVGSSLTRTMSERELANGSLLAIFNDVHIGIHDDPALRLAVEVAEAAGATHNILNGDNHDCGPVAPHELKARQAGLDNGSLIEEAATGRWFTDWANTRPCLYGTGNHEDWINDLALRSGTVGSVTVASALGLPRQMEVLPHGYQIRIGNLVIEHGDVTIGKGGGGANVAQSILNRFPDQTTIVGHFHRISYATRTSADANGILRTRAAYSSGHLSDPTAHIGYAGRVPNWQQGFTLVRIWYDAGKPRFTIVPIEIHRDRYGRPICEYDGRIYR